MPETKRVRYSRCTIFWQNTLWLAVLLKQVPRIVGLPVLFYNGVLVACLGQGIVQQAKDNIFHKVSCLGEGPQVKSQDFTCRTDHLFPRDELAPSRRSVWSSSCCRMGAARSA